MNDVFPRKTSLKHTDLLVKKRAQTYTGSLSLYVRALLHSGKCIQNKSTLSISVCSTGPPDAKPRTNKVTSLRRQIIRDLH